MMDLHRPQQTDIPDDLVPNRTGYTNDQLATRTLAEVVASLVLRFPAESADEQLMQTRALNDVFALTEPKD